jgi:hypothetical protein
LALEGVARNVATPVPKPDTPVEIGKPVILVATPEAGVPSAGVTKVGDVANTNAPEPVSFVTAAARLADVGVPSHVATPEPKDVMPVPPLATGKVPVTPVDKGSPVKFVATPDCGVPSIGVTSVGDVANTADPDPVSSVKAPARLAELNEPNEVALPVEVIAPVKLALVVTFPAVKPAAVPVMFVPTSADGVPSAGVTSVGLVANTAAPEPVSSVKAPARLAELNEPNTVALPVEVIAPVKLALVVTLPAVSPVAVPVMFVPTRADGVPRAGVTSVGELART